MSRVGAIILAAGGSSRLGRPKQLLAYRGRTLVEHVASEAVAAGMNPVVVVTGAYRVEVEEVLRVSGVRCAFNPEWETGMASGIVAGLSALLLACPDLNAVVIAVCDQPFISASLLLKLAGEFDTSGKGIVGCSYAGSVGTPVVFGAAYFERLLVLSGNEGAKKLLRQYSDDLATVDFPSGAIDIDTPDDARKLLE